MRPRARRVWLRPAEGIDLTFDQTLWEAKAKQAGASSDTMALHRAAAAAERPSRPRATISTPSYENKKIKVSDEVFKYINDRNKLLEEMQDLSDQMVKLLEAKQALGTVTATSEGYIVALDLKAGDSYDGQKSAYTIAKKEDVPVLRADVTDLKKDVSEGARVEMAGDYDTFRSEVTAVVDDTDGRKYAEIELTEDFLRTAGGMQKLLQDGTCK